MLILVLVIVSLILRYGIDDYFNYGSLDPRFGYFWINLIRIISSGIAIYYLYMLFHHTRYLTELQHIDLSGKIWSILLFLMAPEF